MSFTCQQCGFENPADAEWCQNPAPQAGGRRCDAFLPYQPGWGQAPPPSPTPAVPEDQPTVKPTGGPQPSASLSPASLKVAPGESVSCEIKVRNNSEVVDDFVLEIIGAAAAWASVEPDALPLFPKAEGTARVFLRPPRSPQVLAGMVPFAVGVRSKANPQNSVLAPATIEVEPFWDLGAELQPRESSGRLSANHRITLSNQGNAPVAVALAGVDPGDLLDFRFTPPRPIVQPGGTTAAGLRVKPHRWMWWRQAPQRRPFQVVESGAAGSPMKTEGAMLQKALIPVKAPVAIIAMAAVVLGLLAIPLAPRLGAGIDQLRRTIRTSQAAAVASPSPQASAMPSDSPAASPLPSPSPHGAQSPSPGPSPSPSTPGSSPTPAASPTIAAISTPIASNSNLTFPTGQCLNLDNAMLYCGFDYDIVTPLKNNFIAPASGATFNNLGVLSPDQFKAKDVNSLRGLTYGPDPIQQPEKGRAFAVKTSRGNYSKVQIVAVLADGWTLSFTTYAGP